MSSGWRWVEIIETWRDINVSHSSRSQLISIQVSIYASHLHPGHVSPSCRSRKLHLVSIQVQSETHPGIITSIHVLPHLHPCPENLVPPPSMYHLTSIQVQKFFSSCHPYRGSPPLHLNSMQVTIWFATPPTSRPMCTEAPRFTCHLHPGRAATQSRIPHFCLITIQFMSNPNAGPGKCISVPSRSHISWPSTSKHIRLTSIQVIPYLTFPRLLSHPPPCTVSHRSVSPNSSIHVASHFKPGHAVGIAHPSIQVKRIAPQLHPSSTATYPGLKMCVSTQPRSHLTPKSQYLHSISTQA